jgi:hypothetical protein
MTDNFRRLGLIPTGKLDFEQEPGGKLARSHNCYAFEYRNNDKWAETSLSVSWDASDKSFQVEFKGLGKGTGLNLRKDEDITSFVKSIPIKIANKSNCDCGGRLSLGAYEMTLTGDDYTLTARYFCHRCQREMATEGSGFMALIRKWVVGLKKINIGPVAVERD